MTVTTTDDRRSDDHHHYDDDNDSGGNAIQTALERTGGVVPSSEWYRSCLEQLQQCLPLSVTDADSGDAVYAQILHHDLRCVVDRSRPSRAARYLRDWILRPQQQPQTSGATASSLSSTSPPLRLLVQVEDVANVALSRESRMAVPAAADGTVPPPSTARCLKLQLVDGYSHRGGGGGHDDKDDSNRLCRHGEARSAHLHSLVAMELSPIPNLSEKTAAGTKLLLCFAVLRASRGVLLLTPQNCMVVGGHVTELAKAQTSQRLEARERSGFGTDPTVRALISQNYLGAREDDEPHDEREGESRDESRTERSAAVPTLASIAVTHRPLTLTALGRDHPIHPGNTVPTARIAAVRPVVPPTTLSVPANPYSTTTPFSSTQATVPRSSEGMAPPRTSIPASSVLVSTTNTATASAATTKSISRTAVASRAGSTPTATNPYAHAFGGGGTSTQPSKAQMSTQSGLPSSQPGSNQSASTQAQSTVSSRADRNFESSTSVASVPTGSALTLQAPAVSPMSMASSSLGPTLPPPAGQLITPYRSLYGMVEQASRDRALYEQLHATWLHTPLLARLVQVPPKISFGIDKVPKRLRSSPSGNSNRIQQQSISQPPLRKHEYALVARFRGAPVTTTTTGMENDDPCQSRCITCKLADRTLEPYFVHPADELRVMRKADRATIDEIVLDGGRKLQAWTTREQLYRVRLLLPPDEFFASSPSPAVSSDTRPVLYLDTP